MAGWSKVSSNKILGVLWANDDDGRTFAKVMPAELAANGFKVIDPGRFDLPANNFLPEIAAFKAANVELVSTVIPGPDFTVFLNQAAQQGLKLKTVTAGKVAEFPQGVYPYGDRAINMLIEVWWSKFHPICVEPYGSILDGIRHGIREEHQQAGVDGPRLPPRTD